MNPLEDFVQSKTKLRLTIAETVEDATALKKAGVGPVRLVTDPSSIWIPVGYEYEIDPDVRQFSEFTLAVRSEALRDELAMSLGDTCCSWIDWSTVDLGEIEKHSRPMWVDEIALLDDIPDEPEQVGYKTGFQMLDEHGFRVVRPAFMPVIGPYGSGKSVLLRQLAVNLWKMHGWRTLITAFEEKVKPRYVRDLRRHLANWNGDLSINSPDTLDREINSAFRFLRRKRNARLDADRLVDRIDYAARVYGVDVCIIDPVNEIDHSVPKGMSKTDYMGEFIMKLKHLADDHRMLMIVAAHPPKDAGAKRSGDHIYTLNDGADTAHYGNKADIGWCVWRKTGTGATFLNIDKCKDVEVMGRPTLAKLSFVPHREKFNVTMTGDDVIAEIAGV
jgi:twinkle protein